MREESNFEGWRDTVKPFKVGSWQVDPNRYQITQESTIQDIQPKVAEVLSYMALRAGELVLKEELVRDVWDGRFVSDDALTRIISLIRSHLKDSAQKPQYIKTVPRHGYRLIAPVEFPTSQINVVAPDDSVTIAAPTYFPEIYKKCFLIAIFLLIAGLAVYLAANKLFSSEAVEFNPPPLSIAVLPIRDIGEHGAYFSAGLTDMIISVLANNHPLNVTSYTSVRRYQDHNEGLPSIAKKLNTRFIVEGSVIQKDDRIRISASLVDTTQDARMWSKHYDRAYADILTLQTEVALEISQAIVGEMVNPELSKQPMAMTISPAAYEAFLKGQFFRNKLTEEGIEKAISFYQQSLAIEPKFAPAHLGLAACHCMLGGTGFEFVPPLDTIPTAKKHLRNALEINDRMGEAYGISSIIQLKFEWDFDQALSDINRAMELNPSFALGRIWQSQVYEALGQKLKAIVAAERARQLDPLSLEARVNLGWQLLRHDRLIEASVQFEQALELEPDAWVAHWAMGYYYLRSKLYHQAIEAFETAGRHPGGHALPLASLAYTYSLSGKEKDAVKIIQELETRSTSEYISPYLIATIYSGLGKRVETLQWLQRAKEKKSKSLAWLSVAFEYDWLRQDPEFVAFMESLSVT